MYPLYPTYGHAHFFSLSNTEHFLSTPFNSNFTEGATQGISEDDAFCVDLVQRKQFTLKNTPHIFISPSRFKPFVRVCALPLLWCIIFYGFICITWHFLHIQTTCVILTLSLLYWILHILTIPSISSYTYFLFYSYIPNYDPQCIHGCTFINPGSFSQSRKFALVRIAPSPFVLSHTHTPADSASSAAGSNEGVASSVSSMLSAGTKDILRPTQDEINSEPIVAERIRVDLCRFEDLPWSMQSVSKLVMWMYVVYVLG